VLSHERRVAILELHRGGVSPRQIARALGVARGTVKKVIVSGSSIPPPVVREEKAAPYRREILELHASCKGNLTRVHEELGAMGASVSYQALTAFCRRQGIGTIPPTPCGEYHFRPGQESQHDTSPHRVNLGGKERAVQTASLALCYSRMLFFQCYPTFNRFLCKVFLTAAAEYMGGMCETAMIDNTHVVVLRGTGADMVPVPEMAAFADRFGFTFRAHAKGDANRSARVERPFAFIEGNFLAGRSFTDWHDLNRQARLWCDKVNQTYKKHLRACPVELFATERPHLKPLPLWRPEPYLLHHRTVDCKGYVNVNCTRYSAPVRWIGRQVEVKETWTQMTITLDERNQVVHERMVDGSGHTVSKPEHRPPRGTTSRQQPLGEEKVLLELYPELAEYVRALVSSGRKQVTLTLRQLLRMAREYPREPFLAAVAEAARYGLYELERVERMVIRRVAGDYFRLGGDDDR